MSMFFIYSVGQLKAELTVIWTLCSEPEPYTLFCIRQYAGDADGIGILARKLRKLKTINVDLGPFL